MRIVDGHHHLWDLEAVRYPWLMAKGVTRFFGDPAPIQKNYLVDDLREDARDVELTASVHVQVGAAEGEELAETAWLSRTADAHGLPTAIVAACDLSCDAVEARLDEQCRYARVRGIRQIVGRSDAEDAQTGSGALLENPRWREGLALLADRDLSFDLQLVPAQTARAAEVLAAVPGLRVALCHCGSPWDQTPAGLASWRRGLELVAELPGACCKLSGFGMFDHRWTTDSVRPLIETCIDVFGAERCMFGSNFPVDKLHRDYTTLWRAYAAVTGGLDTAERQSLFGDTARRFYRL
ncbi:MAG: amidohydrolase family protein [Pseudomonadota bacterium]